MGLKESIASNTIDAITKNLDKNNAPEENTTFGSKLLRFIISFIWGFVTIIVTCLAFYAMFLSGMFNFFEISNNFAVFGIVAPLLIFIITFIIPYLRKKGSFTRSCGIIALGDALWWAYIYFTEF